MTRPKPRARTRVVKAFALVSVGGKLCRLAHSRRDAEKTRNEVDRFCWQCKAANREWPHRVVPLTGVVTLKGEK